LDNPNGGKPPTWVLFLTLIISTDRGPVLNSSSSFFPCSTRQQPQFIINSETLN
jgi:hypothetical protein